MPDIKQRAHKLLEERLRNVSLADAIYTDFGYGCMECGGGIKESWVKSFIDEIIDIAVAEERERVVGMMGHYTIKCKESRRIADLTIEQFISIITEPKPKLSAEALNIK